MKNAELGTLFKSLREKSNLSQQQMAKFLQVDQSVISRFESGERGMTVDALEKACELFGITLSEFYARKIDNLQGIVLAFRAKNLTEEDVEAVVAMNRMAMNVRYMEELLEGGKPIEG